MKPIYLFIFIIGVCLGQNPPTSLNSGGAKEPTVPGTNHSLAKNEVNRDEPNHDTKTAVVQTSDPKNNTTESPVVPKVVVHDPKRVQSTESESTQVPITTSAAPAPAPAPEPEYGIGSWSVTDGKGGNVCIMIKGEMTLYMVNEMNNTVIHSFRVPKNAPSRGNCSHQCIEFDLPHNSSLHLMFKKNASNSTFYVHAIKAKLFIETKMEISSVYENDTLHLFENPVGQSYYCAPSSDNLVAKVPMLHLNLKVNDFQVQAFMNSTKPEFDSAVDCETHTPDVVPIVVGCALAILVILVLVAYLISRRRSQARGYLSM